MSRSMVGSPPPSGDTLTPPRFAPPGFGAGRCAKTASEKNAGEKKRAAKSRPLVTRKTMTNSTGWRGHRTTALSYTAVLHSRHAIGDCSGVPAGLASCFPRAKPRWPRKAWHELAACFADDRTLPSSGFRLGDVLLLVHHEKQVMTEAVPPVNAFPSPVVIHFRALRQPHLHVRNMKPHRAVFDGGVIGNQLDLRHRGNQVGFQPCNIETVCENPGAPLQSDRKRTALRAQPVRADRNGLVPPLPEMDLPSRRPVPTRPSFAGHLKVYRVIRVENECQSRQPAGDDAARESRRRAAAISIFFHAK